MAKHRKNILSFVKSLAQSGAGCVREHAQFVFPSSLALPVQQKRTDIMLSRIRTLMWVLAIVVPVWSFLDAIAFPHDLFISIFQARLLAGASFACFLFMDGIFLKNGIRHIFTVYLQLAVIFVIPTLLYVFFYRLPTPVFEASVFSGAIANSYHLLPFVILACLGFFPLTIIESLAIVTPFLAAYYVTTSTYDPLLWSLDMGMGWVMAILAAISIIISYSQLRMLVQLVGFSSYDHLTDCLGRRSGEEIVKTLWYYSTRRKSNLAVAFIDLDHFKAVNDSFGHQIGDSVLADTAATIKRSLRKSDFVIRWGGEEFLVILPDASIENATLVVKRMAKMGFCIRPDGSPQTVSIGIAERINDNTDDKNTLIDIADSRLYQAKVSGRCRAVGTETTILFG